MENKLYERLNKWLDTTFNDFYIMYSESFSDEGGFKVVEHPAMSDNLNFLQLIRNLFPGIEKDVTFIIDSPEELTLIAWGDKITIKPFDEMIHHTQYVKEEIPNGQSN